MEEKKIKQILAGFSIAGLIAGAGLSLPGCYSDLSGSNPGSESAVEKQAKDTGSSPATGKSESDYGMSS